MSAVGTSAAPPHATLAETALGYDGWRKHDRIPLEKQDSSGSMARPSGTTEITATQRMISATWGSVLTSLLVTPLDVVRVRLQSQPSKASAINISKFPDYSTSFKRLPPDLGVSACCREVFFVGNQGDYCIVNPAAAGSTTTAADCAVEETQRKTFTSTLDGIRKIARNEGVFTLWRGLSPTLLMAIPANVIYFTGYDWMRYSAASPIHRTFSDTYAPLVAGSVARVAAAIAVSPIEILRTRMQATSGHSNNVLKDTAVGLYRMSQTQGYTSLWRGLTLTMWRDVPFSGIYWWGYEALRNQLHDLRATADGGVLHPRDSWTTKRSQKHADTATTHSATFIDSFLAGAGSGAIAAFVTTPFDVGKTRQQTFRHSGDDQKVQRSATKAKVAPEEMSMPRFLTHIYQHEGVGGLFRGWAPRVMKVAPACAIMISSYEVGKRWAGVLNQRQKDGDGDKAV